MLRGINVSGQKRIVMEDLKKLHESLGLENVQTYIQSGNVIFNSSEKNILKLTSLIEEKIKKSFGFDVTVIIRTKDELFNAVKKNPFQQKKGYDTSRLYITLMSVKPDKTPIKEIEAVKSKFEEINLTEKEIYFYCPDGYGKTKLSNNFFEKKLKVTATTRNWNTVNKLLELAD